MTTKAKWLYFHLCFQLPVSSFHFQFPFPVSTVSCFSKASSQQLCKTHPIIVIIIVIFYTNWSFLHKQKQLSRAIDATEEDTTHRPRQLATKTQIKRGLSKSRAGVSPQTTSKNLHNQQTTSKNPIQPPKTSTTHRQLFNNTN